VSDVFRSAGDEVIDSDNLMPLGEESVAEMRANEPSPTGNECAHKVFLPWVVDGNNYPSGNSVVANR